MNMDLYFRYTTDVPFYINVVREPLSQYISMYYFFRTESVMRDQLFTKEEKEMVCWSILLAH